MKHDTVKDKHIILFADDEPDSVLMINQMFRRHALKDSYDIMAVNSLNGAFDLYMASLDSGRYVDVVFTDLNSDIPGDMSGYDLALKLRELQKANGSYLRIIAATGSDPSAIKEKCKEHGIDDLLHKPYSRDSIAQMIIKYALPHNP